MKKTINFSKGFIPASIISCLIIIFGLVGLFTKGINLGLDFKPGLIEEVRVANPVANIVYNGSAKISVELYAGQMNLIISGTGATNETKSFNFAVLTDVNSLAAEVNKVDGVVMSVNDGSYDTTKLFLNSAASTQLTTTPLQIYQMHLEVKRFLLNSWVMVQMLLTRFVWQLLKVTDRKIYSQL